MKVWQDGKVELDKRIESYTIGKDRILDTHLVKYDVFGSTAHAYMLHEIGILTEDEFRQLKRGLKDILELNRKGDFNMSAEDEDVHSKIERYLTMELGDVGKKLHTGRSRNDQVMVDIRLYSREKLLELKKILVDLCKALLDLAQGARDVLIPGYTHMRKAMPSSVGLWSSSFIESLLDDLIYIDAAYNVNNQNPLGSAAGYGVPLPLDRDLTTELLGFEKVQNNVLYVQNSRGKVELGILDALKQVMLDLNRLASDILLFTMDEFGFFDVPQELCTGSSIMPHKNNPDVLELVRANYYQVLGESNKVASTMGSLPSGYNRDVQNTKGSLMDSLQLTISTVSICSLVVFDIKVNRKKTEEAMSPSLFVTDRVFELTHKGVPFREAYMKCKNENSRSTSYMEKNFELKNYKGAPGELGLELLKEQIGRVEMSVNGEHDRVQRVFDELMEGR